MSPGCGEAGISLAGRGSGDGRGVTPEVLPAAGALEGGVSQSCFNCCSCLLRTCCCLSTVKSPVCLELLCTEDPHVRCLSLSPPPACRPRLGSLRQLTGPRSSPGGITSGSPQSAQPTRPAAAASSSGDRGRRPSLGARAGTVTPARGGGSGFFFFFLLYAFALNFPPLYLLVFLWSHPSLPLLLPQITLLPS